MEKRIAVSSIIIEDLNAVNEVNAIIHEYDNLFVGRFGLPFRERGFSVISLIADGSLDEINSFSGKIGRIENVSIKTNMTNPKR